MMGDIKFLDTLKAYDKDNIPKHIMKTIREKYVNNPYFDPNLVKKVQLLSINSGIKLLRSFFPRPLGFLVPRTIGAISCTFNWKNKSIDFHMNWP